MKKYNLSAICKRANELIKVGYDKSTAFKTAWAEAKARVETVSVVEANDLASKAKAFKNIQAQIEKLQTQADELKQGIIAEMDGQEEITADIFTVRYITVMRNILDTNKFKQDNKDLYNMYLKSNESKRFTITA